MNTLKPGYQATINWYNDHADDYASTIKDKPDLDVINRFIKKLKKGSNVLDAGCAGGRDCRIFKDHELVPTGIDISESLIRIAKKQNPDIDFLEGSFLELPFAKETFDGIWAHCSLVHFEKISEVQKALKEFHRVLKTDGIVHIKVKQQKGEQKTSFASHDFSGEFERFFRFFTKEEIEGLIRRVGFSILDTKERISEDRGIDWIIVLAQKL